MSFFTLLSIFFLSKWINLDTDVTLQNHSGYFLDKGLNFQGNLENSCRLYYEMVEDVLNFPNDVSYHFVVASHHVSFLETVRTWLFIPLRINFALQCLSHVIVFSCFCRSFTRLFDILCVEFRLDLESIGYHLNNGDFSDSYSKCLLFIRLRCVFQLSYSLFLIQWCTFSTHPCT